MKSRFRHRTAMCAIAAALASGCSPVGEDDSRVFRYNESANLSSLDPAFARTLEPMWVVDQLFDGLVELDDQLRVQPLIARSYEVDESGMQWTFVLRDDVHFTAHPEVPGLEQGRRVVAADVVYSLNRLRDATLASSGRWILDPLDEAAPGQGLVAHGLDTVVFQLRAPYPPFLGLLATAYANVVPVEAVEHFGMAFRNNPVGSGPFQLAWWMEDVACVLHKNPRYWETDAAGQSLPYLDAVHISFASDMGAEYQGLLHGRYDFMSGLHPAYMEELLNADGSLRAKHADAIRMETTPFLKTDYIGFFVDASQGGWRPWCDVTVRQALSMALDRDGIAKALRRGAVVPTSEFVPPALLGKKECESSSADAERSRHLLDSVRNVHPEPWPKLVISTTSDYTDLCAAIQFQWEAIGLDVEVDVVAASTHRDRVANGKVAAFRKSWLADYPDAENFLSLFRKENFAPSGPNYTHFADPNFETLMGLALQTTNEPERLELYDELNKIIAEELPVIPLFHDQVTHFLSPEVVGWEINAINRLDLRRVSKRTSKEKDNS